MIKNGRQTAININDIREDHRKRYECAITHGRKKNHKTVVDIGTGIGYGAWMMAQAGFQVTAYELDPDAIAYGEQYYSHPNLVRKQADIGTLILEPVDMITGFEIIEHTTAAPLFLKNNLHNAKSLVISVPNEDIVPFVSTKHWQHVRHYTPEQLREELTSAGWIVKRIGCQTGKVNEGAVVNFSRTDGRTLIAIAGSP
jgi:2-polyprenyl-3-methyl-5-hydroxy-6-metoxy-1,4-benzoquinol methylase